MSQSLLFHYFGHLELIDTKIDTKIDTGGDGADSLTSHLLSACSIGELCGLNNLNLRRLLKVEPILMLPLCSQGKTKKSSSLQ